MRRKTVLIDPRDVEHPFNLGFVDFERIKRMPPAEQEIAFAGVIDMLNTAIGSSDEMTQKQETLFHNIFKLIKVIPGASILSMAEEALHRSHRLVGYPKTTKQLRRRA